jgi:hypothetical protein
VGIGRRQAVREMQAAVGSGRAFSGPCPPYSRKAGTLPRSRAVAACAELAPGDKVRVRCWIGGAHAKVYAVLGAACN